MADLFQTLTPFNSHWTTGEASPLVRKHKTARRSFRHIKDRIHALPFEVLVGPRQVGKTTLVGNLIDDLLQRGVPPRSILFVPCDHPGIALETRGQAGPLVAFMQERVLQQSLASMDAPCYLFLDEVHDLDDWPRQLKALYDEHHPRLRVFATGSSSTALLRPASADLAGRVRTSRIHPLKFNEAVEMLVPALADPRHLAYDAGRRAREALATPHAPESRAALDALHASLAPYSTDVIAAFERYLTRGGFPIALAAKTDSEALLFHEQTIDLVLARDLAHHPRIRKPNEFRSFLALLARQHGGKFVASNVKQTLGLDKETPAHWKEIAESLFLVQQLAPLNEKLHALPGKTDKAYLLDPGIRAYLSAERSLADLEASGRIGHVVEGVLQDHVRRLQFNLFTRLHNRIGYTMRPEIDIVAEVPRGWLAIEVKYSTRTEPAVRSLERTRFTRENVQRIVATRSTFDLSRDTWVLPAWLLAFLC